MESASEGQSFVDGRFQWIRDKMGRKDSPSNAGTSGEIRFGPQEERNSPVHYDTDTFNLKYFLSAKGDHMSWENIKKVVTVNALCDAEDPIKNAFKVHAKLLHLAETTTENTKSLENLADNVQDFAFDFLDQVERKEDMRINDEDMDRYGSLFSDMTDKAIAEQQKKFLSHPFVFKRVEKRWKYGLSEDFQFGKLHRCVLLLIMMLDTILTPLLLPLIACAFLQNQPQKAEGEKSKSLCTRILETYRWYSDTPCVIFVKTQFMQLIFIVLHFWLSINGSSVAPTIEEALVLFFFVGFVVSEIHQYKTSAEKVYFRDMWNYLDMGIVFIYVVILVCRIATFIIGGDAFHNRWLEIANYSYGFNTLFLTLRFSSILELSSVVGPLQLALFQMLRDLLIILIQFAFVIVAFSMAITKCYTAEKSYMIPQDSKSNYTEYCVPGNFNCLLKSAIHLVWSVFGMTHFEEMESQTSTTTIIVVLLFLCFLVLSVIMLVNILVALLTATYDKYKNCWEIEWKFSRSVMEEQYRRMHVVVVPFNILTLPIVYLYWGLHEDTGEEKKKRRKKEYKDFLKSVFFPIIKNRYKEKYKGSFPSTVDSKLDTLEENLSRVKRELGIQEEKEQGSQEPNRVVSVKSRLERMEEKLNILIERLGQTKEQSDGKGQHKMAAWVTLLAFLIPSLKSY
ncbi:short transient receptor potential channel 5 isoform X2 [Pocillopora verrucosa]|uniref:short transient receptor potential channel 5 isoform X2 n=1 Tax=Pocillopora verrucosa TaxID=203993 RepID=UPI003340B061